MSYIRDYKNLREALNCMAADGVDKQQAQLSICEALLAKTIKLRVSIDRSDPDLGGAVLADHNVQLPQHFSPVDLDWAESRPWQQWSTGLSAWDWKLRSIEWIEICEADLIVLIHSIGPPPLRPTGGGYMPLTAAAHWIASVGGKLLIGADESYWRPAYEKLLSAIMKGAEIVGRRNETGIPERIPKETFVGLDIAYPCSDFATDLHLGGRAFIDCCLYIDEQFWCDHSDRLFTQGRSDIAAWSHLAVEMDAVARVCPAAITEPPAPPPGGEPRAAAGGDLTNERQASPPIAAAEAGQSSVAATDIEQSAPFTTAQLMVNAKKVVDQVAQRHKNQNGIVPNVKEHTTEAMGLLSKQFPGNHATRSEVEKMAKEPVYANDRRQRGETTERALKRFETGHRSL